MHKYSWYKLPRDILLNQTCQPTYIPFHPCSIHNWNKTLIFTRQYYNHSFASRFYAWILSTLFSTRVNIKAHGPLEYNLIFFFVLIHGFRFRYYTKRFLSIYFNSMHNGPKNVKGLYFVIDFTISLWMKNFPGCVP